MIRMWNKSGLPPGDAPPPPLPTSSSRSNSLKNRSRPWARKSGTSRTSLRLSVEDLDYLTRNTHYSADEIKNWYKGFSKDCPEGVLQKDQILAMCSNIVPTGNSETFVDQIFRIFDKDGNGSIDFREFMLATDMTKAGNPEEKVRWAFKIYDIDNSGSIDVAEMAEAIRTLYAMEGEEQKESAFLRKAQRLFNVLDTDGDGELNVEEFVAGCLQDEELKRLLSFTTAAGQE